MNKFTIVCTCAASGMFALRPAASAPINGAEAVPLHSQGYVVQVARRHGHRHRQASSAGTQVEFRALTPPDSSHLTYHSA